MIRSINEVNWYFKNYEKKKKRAIESTWFRSVFSFKKKKKKRKLIWFNIILCIVITFFIIETAHKVGINEKPNFLYKDFVWYLLYILF